MKLFSSVLFAGLLLLGCGQKGPLYREPAPATNQNTQVQQPAPGVEASPVADENSQNNSKK